jgi:hypothetical protein
MGAGDAKYFTLYRGISVCLGCFACTQANEIENEAYPLTSLLQLEGQSY